MTVAQIDWLNTKDRSGYTKQNGLCKLRWLCAPATKNNNNIKTLQAALRAAFCVRPTQVNNRCNRPGWPLCRGCCVEDSVHYRIMDTIGVVCDEATEASGLV